jgi:hypothetical protein
MSHAVKNLNCTELSVGGYNGAGDCKVYNTANGTLDFDRGDVKMNCLINTAESFQSVLIDSNNKLWKGNGGGGDTTGRIGSITLSDFGLLFIPNQQGTITGTTGQGALFQVQTIGAGGSIATLNIEDAGSGYTLGETVTLVNSNTAAGASNAVGTVGSIAPDLAVPTLAGLNNFTGFNKFENPLTEMTEELRIASRVNGAVTNNFSRLQSNTTTLLPAIRETHLDILTPIHAPAITNYDSLPVLEQPGFNQKIIRDSTGSGELAYAPDPNALLLDATFSQKVDGPVVFAAPAGVEITNKIELLATSSGNTAKIEIDHNNAAFYTEMPVQHLYLYGSAETATPSIATRNDMIRISALLTPHDPVNPGNDDSNTGKQADRALGYNQETKEILQIDLPATSANTAFTSGAPNVFSNDNVFINPIEVGETIILDAVGLTGPLESFSMVANAPGAGYVDGQTGTISELGGGVGVNATYTYTQATTTFALTTPGTGYTRGNTVVFGGNPTGALLSTGLITKVTVPDAAIGYFEQNPAPPSTRQKYYEIVMSSGISFPNMTNLDNLGALSEDFTGVVKRNPAGGELGFVSQELSGYAILDSLSNAPLPYNPNALPQIFTGFNLFEPSAGSLTGWTTFVNDNPPNGYIDTKCCQFLRNGWKTTGSQDIHCAVVEVDQTLALNSVYDILAFSHPIRIDLDKDTLIADENTYCFDCASTDTVVQVLKSTTEIGGDVYDYRLTHVSIGHAIIYDLTTDSTSYPQIEWKTRTEAEINDAPAGTIPAPILFCHIDPGEIRLTTQECIGTEYDDVSPEVNLISRQVTLGREEANKTTDAGSVRLQMFYAPLSNPNRDTLKARLDYIIDFNDPNFAGETVESMRVFNADFEVDRRRVWVQPATTTTPIAGSQIVINSNNGQYTSTNYDPVNRILFRTSDETDLSGRTYRDMEIRSNPFKQQLEVLGGFEVTGPMEALSITTSNTTALGVISKNSFGDTNFTGECRISKTAPTLANDPTGVLNEIRVGGGYLYMCVLSTDPNVPVGTTAWIRVQGATW